MELAAEDAGSGVGGGGDASIQPIGFLVVTTESVQLLTFKEKGMIEQIVEQFLRSWKNADQ